MPLDSECLLALSQHRAGWAVSVRLAGKAENWLLVMAPGVFLVMAPGVFFLSYFEYKNGWNDSYPHAKQYLLR